MSVPTDSQSILIESTPAQIQLAFAKAVQKSGFTVEQLQEQAADGHFASFQARRAWVAVGGLINGGMRTEGSSTSG